MILQHPATIFHNTFDVTLDQVGFGAILLFVAKYTKAARGTLDADGGKAVHGGAALGFSAECRRGVQGASSVPPPWQCHGGWFRYNKGCRMVESRDETREYHGW